MSKEKAMAEPTICARCMFIDTESYEGLGIAVCRVQTKINYVTGKPIEEMCSSKNNGNCPDFRIKAGEAVGASGAAS